MGGITEIKYPVLGNVHVVDTDLSQKTDYFQQYILKTPFIPKFKWNSFKGESN